MRNRSTKYLNKPKVRQSWSKYNLYNLSRITNPPYKAQTFFQQKWTAKSTARSYHGEQVGEGKWERLFSRRLRYVIPMNPEYLASNDGSLESAGRGSGIEKERQKGKLPPIPYMQMTFAPLERRLDTAIFRAMFASSARQARQFVIHGAVKVNGRKMQFPGYMLNPGDMFQVDPERVMFAIGVPKVSSSAKADQTDEANEDDDAVENSDGALETTNEGEKDVNIEREPREILKDLLAQSRSILSSPRESAGAKKKQDLRAFSKAVKRMLSRSASTSVVTESLEAQFMELQNQLKIQRVNKQKSKPALPSDQKAIKGEIKEGSSNSEDAPSEIGTIIGSEPAEEDVTVLSDREYNQLYAALQEMQENPVDNSKSYATPWMPREYMSAFAFIPRYLEVNQNICAAVYLRHPVAKPGLAEVPTPFGDSINGSAFSWYLRRR